MTMNIWILRTSLHNFSFIKFKQALQEVKLSCKLFKYSYFSPPSSSSSSLEIDALSHDLPTTIIVSLRGALRLFMICVKIWPAYMLETYRSVSFKLFFFHQLTSQHIWIVSMRRWLQIVLFFVNLEFLRGDMTDSNFQLVPWDAFQWGKIS